MHPSVKQRRLCGQRYIGIRNWREHTLAYSMRWLFWQTAELGLIKCSDKNQSFIKVCSHSGSARPRSWNVSWKPASCAQECCLSYLIRRSCCVRVWKRAGADERRRRRGSWQQPACFLAQALLWAHWPMRVCPYINPVHVGGKAHRGFQENKQGQLLLLQLLSPSSAPPARRSTASSPPYFKQDFFFTLSLLCHLAQCQISKLIKRGTDWAYVFPSVVSCWQRFWAAGSGDCEQQVGTN